MWRILLGGLVLFVLAGCARSTAGSPAAGSTAPSSQGPKRVVIAMAGDPPGLSTHINPAGTATPGLPELTGIIAPGLSTVDSDGRRVPVLAAELPATDRREPKGSLPFYREHKLRSRNPAQIQYRATPQNRPSDSVPRCNRQSEAKRVMPRVEVVGRAGLP